MQPGLAFSKLQIRLSIPASTLSHIGRLCSSRASSPQERDATTPVCRTNPATMRAVLGLLAAECCTPADRAAVRQGADTAA
jgi:hypothetical protein